MSKTERLAKDFALNRASGHYSREELKEVINTIKPKKIYPVHTEHEEEFREIVRGVREKGAGERVKI